MAVTAWPRAAALLLLSCLMVLSPGAQANTIALYKVGGTSNTTAWTLTREQSVDLVVNYTCGSSSTYFTVYISRYQSLYYNYDFTSLGTFYCSAVNLNVMTYTLTMDVSNRLYDIYAVDDGTFYIALFNSYYYSYSYLPVKVTRSRSDYIDIRPATRTLSEGQKLNVSIKFSVNKRTQYYYSYWYGGYGTTIALKYDGVDSSGSTTTLSLDSVTKYAFYGTYNVSVPFYYGITNDVKSSGTYNMYVTGYYDNTGYNSMTTTTFDTLPVTVAFDGVKTLKMGSSTCTYGKSDCSFTFTSSTAQTKVNVYIVASTSSATPVYSSGVVTINSATIAPYLEGISAGTYSFPASKEQSPGLLASTSYTIWLVVVDPSGYYAALRTDSVEFAVECAFPYYGTTCAESQNLTNSFAVGFFSAAMALVVLLFVFLGDWIGRFADRARRNVTERAVTACRNMVTAFNALAAADAAAKEQQQQEAAGIDVSRSKAGLLGKAAAGGAAVGTGLAVAAQLEHAQQQSQQQSGAAVEAEGGAAGGQEEDGTAVLGGALKTAALQSAKLVADDVQASAKAHLQTVASTALSASLSAPDRPAAPPMDLDPLALLKKKALPVIKELAVSAAIYVVTVFGAYIMDFLQILANGLLMIKSFASSFNMDLNVVFPTITMNIELVLPKGLHFFPSLFSKALAWFAGIFANISFGQLAMKNMQVTCVGAQAPGEVLNNLILIVILFMVYEVYALEAIRVTFRGFARVSTQFIRRKSVLMGRLAAFTLPGCAVAMESAVKYVVQFVFALLVVSAFFEYKGSHARTAICDSYRDGMDSVIARLGTALFWVTLLPIIHVALKALVPGLPAGELSTPLLSIRNRTLNRVLGGAPPATEETCKEEEGAAADVETGLAASKKKKKPAAKKRRGGCLANLGWRLFDLCFGLNRTDGIDDKPKSIAAIESPRAGPASPTANKVSSALCCFSKRPAQPALDLASPRMPDTPASATWAGSTSRPLTSPANDGKKKCFSCASSGAQKKEERTWCGFLLCCCCCCWCCGLCCLPCCRRVTCRCAWPWVKRILRLAVVLGLFGFAFVRFLFVIKKTSEISQAIALNQTCSSLQSYSSLSSDDSSSSSYYYSSYYYSTTWYCNSYTEYYSRDYREPCLSEAQCIIDDANSFYTTDTAAIIAGCLAVPLALLWLLFRCFNDWHKRQCKQEIVFRDVQRLLPSCMLRAFGYVSRSEKKLQKRLARLAELDRKAATNNSPRSGRFSGLWSPRQSSPRGPSSPRFSLGLAPRARAASPAKDVASVVPPTPAGLAGGPSTSPLPTSPSRKGLVSPTTSRGLRKIRGALPRAWPSVYAVFETIKSPDREGLVWQDLVDTKAALDDMRRTGKGPIPITDAYLKRSFIYQLMKRCEEDVEYETIIKQIFQIVATFTDDEIAKGGHGGPASPSNVDSPITPPGNLSPQPSITLAGVDAVSGPSTSPSGRGSSSSKVGELKSQVKAVAGDLMTVASAALRGSNNKAAEDEEVSMDYAEFRHFVQILVPAREVPSYLELIISMFIDVKDAFQKWAREDKYSVCRLWRVPLYWFDMTLRLYIVVMYWKLVQLMKLTFGFWDRELIEAFKIRDRADEFDEDPDDDRECDLDILAATGQTRVLFWQIMPYTVVLSKLGEAFNFSPPYIEDAAMTERVSFKKALDDDGQVVYEGEPVLRAIKPFAPKSLAWLFPFEYGRADEVGSQGLNGIRLQSFIVSTSKFFTTLLLVAFPQTLWLQIYFFLTVPFRLIESVDVVANMNMVDTELLSETFAPITKALADIFAGAKGDDEEEQDDEEEAEEPEQTEEAAEPTTEEGGGGAGGDDGTGGGDEGAAGQDGDEGGESKDGPHEDAEPKHVQQQQNEERGQAACAAREGGGGGPQPAAQQEEGGGGGVGDIEVDQAEAEEDEGEDEEGKERGQDQGEGKANGQRKKRQPGSPMAPDLAAGPGGEGGGSVADIEVECAGGQDDDNDHHRQQQVHRAAGLQAVMERQGSGGGVGVLGDVGGTDAPELQEAADDIKGANKAADVVQQVDDDQAGK